MARRSKPKTKSDSTTRDVCFVIMPFGGWLDDYYQGIYHPAITAAGLEPHRADDLFRPSTIVNDIWAYTKKARLVLADLSGKNPNVFYELGLAHALAKPAILVVESMDDVPFDLRALRVLVYDKNAPDWGRILKDKVQAAIGEVLKSPVEAVLPAFLETRGSTPKPTVTPQEKEILELRQQIDLLREEFRSSGRVRSVNRLLDAEEAILRIRDYLALGVSDKTIALQLEPLGPPREWTLDQIKRIKLAHPETARKKQKTKGTARK